MCFPLNILTKCTLLTCLFFAVAIGQSTNNSVPLLEIIILHNNDMHARFEQTDALSKVCKEEDSLMSKCYGGFARVAYKLVNVVLFIELLQFQLYPVHRIKGRDHLLNCHILSRMADRK